MNNTSRTRRHQVRQLQREVRARRAAAKAIATGAPASVKVQLVASGLDTATAKRFAGAFSRGLPAVATVPAVIKLRGRVTKRVAVKLVDQQAVAAKLATYRPKDPAAAALFARVAA
jgi:hypothetical protein